jgi:hypothetical protein
VITTLTDFILQPENLMEMHQLLADSQAGLRAAQDSQRRELTSELTGIRKQLQNVADGIAITGGSRTLVKRLADLETLQADLQQKLIQLKTEAVQELPRLDPAQLESRLARLTSILKGKDDQAKKTLLRGLIAYVDVERDEKTLRGTIYYMLPIDEPPDAAPGSIVPSDDDPDDVPSSRRPSGPLIRRHIIAFPFTASTKRPR